MANKKVIDRGMIEEFSEAVDTNKARDAAYSLSDITDDIALELSETNPLITSQNLELVLSGDFLTKTATPNSELDLFLSIRSAQIELNSIGPMEKWWRIYWNKFKNAWQNRRKSTRRAKKKAAKKAKKQAKMLTIEQLSEKKEQPYSILSLKSDFFEHLILHLSDMTVLYNYSDKIRLLAKDEFGYRINIYPAIKHEEGFKVWDNNKNKFILTKPLSATSLLKEKSQEIEKINKMHENGNDILYKIIRIFKSLYYNIYQSYKYQFIESLIYNCPNSLFEMKSSKVSTYDIFIKVLNYLNNANIANYRSIYNDEKPLYEHHDITLYSVKRFIKELDDYLI